MKPESPRPVSIEDLLRLKRAERPPAEFWGEFDRKLRDKQLAALVAKRPWWQRLPRLVPTFARYRFILGGTAVAAMALVTLRDEPAVNPVAVAVEPVAASETLVATPSTAAGFGPVHTVAEELTPSDPVLEVVAVATPVASTAAEVAVEAQITEPLMPENLSRLVALGGGAVAVAEAVQASSSARHAAANLATVRTSEQIAVGRLLGGANGFEARAMPVRSAVDPLQQMTPPGESRRARLLTAMVSSAALETSARSTERAANRLAEEGVYDQIQRFGARGDRVHVKF